MNDVIAEKFEEALDLLLKLMVQKIVENIKVDTSNIEEQSPKISVVVKCFSNEEVKYQPDRNCIYYEGENISGVLGWGKTITDAIDNSRINLKVLNTELSNIEKLFVKIIREDKI